MSRMYPNPKTAAGCGGELKALQAVKCPKWHGAKSWTREGVAGMALEIGQGGRWEMGTVSVALAVGLKKRGG